MDCGPHNCAANTGGRVVFTWLKSYFNVHALIFYVFEGSSQLIASQLNMQKSYGINIFYYEGHNL
jgi:hypothetical protein